MSAHIIKDGKRLLDSLQSVVSLKILGGEWVA